MVLKAEQRLMAAVRAYESGSLASFFAKWMDDLRRAAMWEEGAPDDVRVPIASMVTHHRLPGFQVPDAPGIYLWGSNTSLIGADAFIPRKIGQSGAPGSGNRLRKRMGRYKTGGVETGKNTQCTLARENWGKFRKAAMAGVPSWPPAHGYCELIRAIATKIAFGRRDQMPRWRGAADWALHSRGPDLEGIWVAFLVVPSPTDRWRAQLGPLEIQLQWLADAWNSRTGAAPTINH